MYIPAHFAASPGATQDLLAAPAAANLVTMTSRGILATLLPLVYVPSAGEHGALHGHLARNNPQCSEPPVGEALVILQGADAYISCERRRRRCGRASGHRAGRLCGRRRPGAAGGRGSVGRRPCYRASLA